MATHKNDMMEVGFLDEVRNFRRKYVEHVLASPDPRARMAIDLIDKWGMVAATSDGEDSAGRAKLRLLAPDEMVQRACDTAALAMEAFRARGWMVDNLSLTDLNAAPDDK